MKQLLLTFSVLFITIYSTGQAPGIRWQRTLGGTLNDIPAFSFKTNDNGFITVTETSSNNGDITGFHGGTDIWVSKMNYQGQLIWRRTLGGTNIESPFTYYYNTDGTFLIVGYAASNDGNVSGNHGGGDIWISKLAADGSSIWHKCFGGSGDESNAYSIIKAANGTYVITGFTYSNNGDVSGNHGGADLWVFNINEAGTLQWQIALGGTSNEVFSRGTKTIQTADGSYYVGTETFSNDGNVSGSAGNSDLWLVKLNNAGVFQWQKCLGGTAGEFFNDLIEGQNGELYILGYTSSPGLPNFHGVNTDYSDIFLCRVSSSGTVVFQKCFGGTLSDKPDQLVSTFADGSCIINSTIRNGGGDVIGYPGSANGTEVWFFRVKNDGTIDWQTALGGVGFDGTTGVGTLDDYGGMGKVIQTSDGGFLIPAWTESGNGDVTGYHVPSGFDTSYRSDIWMVKLNSAGALEWQKCFGGYSGEYARGSAIEIGAGDYIVTGYTRSNYGDVQTNNGRADAWILRVAATNTVKGVLYLDENSNGVKEASEPLFSNAIVKTEKAGDARNAVPVNGLFINETDIGDYTTTVSLQSSYYNVVPPSRLSSFTTYFNTDSFSFAIQPIPGIKDLVINAIPLTVARPGFNVSYRIIYKNTGTSIIANGEVLFKKDPRLNFVSSSPAISATNGDTLKWVYSNLEPLDSASITVNLRVQSPPAVSIGDTLTSVGIIIPAAGDQTPHDDTVIIKQIVTGSYDPNDKYEKNEGRITSTYISDGKYLDYLVRFQNLGTDTAFNIEILDTLNSKLDLSSLQIIAVSHACQVNLTGNILKWNFYNIQLPHSAVNEPRSHGYIAYRIRPLNTVNAGDTIFNSASIYFDFNLPVKTNKTSTVVANPTSTLPPTITSFTPTSGGAGATIIITGTNLTGATAVSIGGVAASSFAVNSSISITAVVGSGATGSVTVTTPGGTVTLAGFTFIAAPTVTSITPASGGGGTSISIAGTNLTGATAVSFGGVAATSFTVNSSTSITAIVGIGATGNVSVTTPGGTATLAGFTFIPIPTITSFTPTGGAAGTSITITGTNLMGATAVSLGGVAATSFTVNSSTSITAIAGIGGTGSVSVTTPGGVATLAGFTFISIPTITSFTPTSGSAGTSIIVTGTNFNGATAVSFGGVAASSFTVNSATMITAIVGSGASGNVVVTTPGGTATMTGFTFNTVTGINGPSNNNTIELMVYPNPTSDIAVIKHPSSNKNAQLKVVDIAGRIVEVFVPIRNTRQSQLDLNLLPGGIYNLIWSDGTRILSRTLMIK